MSFCGKTKKGVEKWVDGCQVLTLNFPQQNGTKYIHHFSNHGFLIPLKKVFSLTYLGKNLKFHGDSLVFGRVINHPAQAQMHFLSNAFYHIAEMKG